MFREMRRKRQQLSETDTKKILINGSSGVLALIGDDGYPYTVPLNFYYCDNKIYFHCAKTGHKIDALKKNCKASFCVVEKDTVLPEKFTTLYRSAIAFGKIRLVNDNKEKRAAMEKLASKYAPNEKRADTVIDEKLDLLTILEFSIECLTGKANINLINAD